MIQKVSLLNSKRDFFIFSSFLAFILFYSLLINYNNYKILTRFDSCVVHATLLKQYTKTKRNRWNKLHSYQILKLKADEGFTFYSSQAMSFKSNIGKKITMEIWPKDINFYSFLSNFYASSQIIAIAQETTLKESLNLAIEKQHDDENIAKLYQALFSATSLPRDLQSLFSSLGVSHLIAISGFHLGVLSAILFFLFQKPYKFFQNRYFPYRSYHRDSFFILSIVLVSYMLFLGTPPSLLRAFSMLVIGFLLYDRGVEVFSIQTLFITIALLLALFPSLIFSIGFWLSVGGVFYIFLFIIYFKNLSKLWQFILLPFWVYLMMLPYSLVIFGNFSLYHPLSIIWTSLFTLFYPLSILLHLLNYGNLLDPLVQGFMHLDAGNGKVYLGFGWVVIQVALSLLALYKKFFSYLLLCYVSLVFIYSIYHIA